ncbi:hypothetical protein BST97_07020 [Nonlabens spongiae]|uniref:Glycosyl transferase family 1 domain-containing protein n=1 Tax=Nonlabens spongiae TaxID=331648 RepID=A0A1W6MJX5_9FLAO|nr:glycosyltransferase [Nonlabens spongiae]ARN77769.1 hypothetical protein BST97_07020 [Nonlabens spongiae]
MLLIDGTFINSGGGKVLLDTLIEGLVSKSTDFTLLLDQRCESSEYKNTPYGVIRVRGSYFARLAVYRKLKDKITSVFCLGNFAPPIKLDAHVTTYFHNVLILDLGKYSNIVLKTKVWLRKRLFKMQSENSDVWMVQTDVVKDLLINRSSINEGKIKVRPFYRIPRVISSNKQGKMFVYVSSGAPHKNHHRLLDAWQEFERENSSYTLHLTVGPEFQNLSNKINNLISKGLNIVNHGHLEIEKIWDLYHSAEYLIYPSLKESFGLPLIEATHCNCKVLGSDLPYLYQVVEPSDSFDPLNVESIRDSLLRATYSDLPKSHLQVHNSLDLLVEEILPVKP